MKILVVQDRLRSGGTERQSILLARAFAAAGHPAHLLNFRPGGALAGTVDPRVPRHVLQPFDTRLDWFAPGLAARIAAIRPDVILCMGRMANCYAGRLQRTFPEATVIGTMRTGKKLPAAFRRSLHLVRHIVANSRDARDHLVRSHDIPAEKISVIYNSLAFPDVDSASPLSARETLRARQHASATTCVLLSVAMFRPEKGQRELIEIAAGFPAGFDWQLWLAGDGATRADCEQLVSRKQLQDRVRFLGFTPDPGPLYRAADCAVHASATESLCNFLIEAQSHGLPAVALAARGISECFVPGRTGWEIPRFDHDAFRGTVRTVSRLTPQEVTTRAAQARDFARETFDPQRQVAAYLDLFRRLAEKPAAE